MSSYICMMLTRSRLLKIGLYGMGFLLALSVIAQFIWKKGAMVAPLALPFGCITLFGLTKRKN